MSMHVQVWEGPNRYSAGGWGWGKASVFVSKTKSGEKKRKSKVLYYVSYIWKFIECIDNDCIVRRSQAC